MIYLGLIFLAAISYHAISYSVYLIKKEKNRLAAFGVILMAIINIAAPAALYLLRY